MLRLLFVLTFLALPTLARADMHTAFSESCSNCIVSELQRQPFGADMAHYSAKIRLGSGTYDVIRVDRLVRENSPWHPKATSEALLMMHGDTLEFQSGFTIGWDDGSKVTSLAGLLAAQDVDVWGFSQRDRLVPLSETDDDFMAPWDLDFMVSDLRKVALIARAVRALTGSGGGKLHLLGWSRGGQMGYRAAALESQLPSWQRHFRSYIPFDTMLKTDVPTLQQIFCDLTAAIDTQIAAGQYANPAGATLAPLGQLAIADPNGPTPVPDFAGLTNRQVALFFGGFTAIFTPYAEGYHLIGIDVDEFGVPANTRYTEEGSFFQVVAALPPYEALPIEAQGNRVLCQDTELDDHIGDIAIPVFNIGARGGLGEESVYTTTLLSSSPDVQSLVLTDPAAPKAFDIGHDDIARMTELAADVVAPIRSHLALY